MEDHYSINVARRIKPESSPFGPYHSHMFKVTMPASNTKAEALSIYNDLCAKYPEPEFNVMLSQTVVRTTYIKNSGVVPVSLVQEQSS